MAICTSPEVSRGNGKTVTVIETGGNASLDGSTESGFEEIVLDDMVVKIKVSIAGKVFNTRLCLCFAFVFSLWTFKLETTMTMTTTTTTTMEAQFQCLLMRLMNRPQRVLNPFTRCKQLGQYSGR